MNNHTKAQLKYNEFIPKVASIVIEKNGHTTGKNYF